MLHTNVETDVFSDNKMAPLNVFIVKGLNYSYKIIHSHTSQETMTTQPFYNEGALVLFINVHTLSHLASLQCFAVVGTCI